MSPERPKSTDTENIHSTMMHERLGVSPDATHAEIKSAYRNLAQKYHPDKGGSNEEFSLLQEAYSVLSSGKGVTNVGAAKQEKGFRRPTAPPYEGGPEKLLQDFDQWLESLYELQDNAEQGGIYCNAVETDSTGKGIDGVEFQWDGNDIELISAAAAKYPVPPGMVENLRFRIPATRIPEKDMPYNDYPYMYRAERRFKVTAELYNLLIKDNEEREKSYKEQEDAWMKERGYGKYKK